MYSPKRIFLALLVVMLGVVGTAEDSRAFTAFGDIACGKYLDAYSKTTLTGDHGYEGPYEMWRAAGWMNGFITDVNWEIDGNVAKGMTNNQVRQWAASWCRDNITETLSKAMEVLIFSRK
jgi:hypothetical protein